ncbi:MAG: hypothetical protein A3I68_07270 [Candidatus Melainabacteria bacterium RIFCSPLOWO2_02_FULL_35_15]|nr:MAG: hypothetical protein A3F80_03155 [Candidatus Melainabacteria bacterium RIFCSPLOWO2_12_FULL_35_11]OGI12935.1 MAG: hypothetical protein A3I68_07270 [Candidatus Melainabacteria bacterium RIFCSPLOWO2_02_FULL_35_15]
MLKKSKLLALVLVTSVLMPTIALADEASSGCKKTDPIFGWTIGLPFKAVGATLSTGTGVLVGTTSGLIRGASKGTKAVADAFGDEKGVMENIAGLVIGAVPGAVVHGVVGGLLWGGKGFVDGWEKPFKCQTLHSALEGIPNSIEWTAEGASKAFSS